MLASLFFSLIQKVLMAQFRKNTKARLEGKAGSSRTPLQGIKELKSCSNNKVLREITREQNKPTGEP